MTNCNSKILEVCINADNLEMLAHNISIVNHSSAKRIELCANMNSGGTTPSATAIRIARALSDEATELLVMIRPQPHSFVMSSKDIAQMHAQIEIAATLGATGVVLGALTATHDIAHDALTGLMATALKHNLKVTFHRAFDDIHNQFKALDTLINLGVSRVLTSGMPWRSTQGADCGYEHIQILMTHTQGQIEFVVGGQVNIHNAARLWHVSPEPHYPMSLHTYSGVLSNKSHVCPHTIEAIIHA